MPLSAGANLSFSNGSRCDLLYASNALPASSIGGWLKSADDTWPTIGLATVFDVRQYSTVIFTLACTAVTGSSSPTAQIILVTYDDPDGAIAGPQFTVTQTVGGSGGISKATFGVVPTTHVGMSDNFTMARTQERLMFFRLGIQGGGTPTGFTNGRLRVWGYG